MSVYVWMNVSCKVHQGKEDIEDARRTGLRVSQAIFPLVTHYQVIVELYRPYNLGRLERDLLARLSSFIHYMQSSVDQF
jgi:hypothetical protein